MDVNPVFQRYLSAPKAIKSEYIALRIVRRHTALCTTNHNYAFSHLQWIVFIPF